MSPVVQACRKCGGSRWNFGDISFRSRDIIYFRFRVRHFENNGHFTSRTIRWWQHCPQCFGHCKNVWFMNEFCLMTLVFNIVHNFMTFRAFWPPSWILEVSRDKGKIVYLWTNISNICHTKRFWPRFDISHRSRVTSRWMHCGVILPPPRVAGIRCQKNSSRYEG